tara:strand:+ start:40 stop:1026 length:987 start_codon:yes stop_codon:yes gene_type:complete
MHWVRQASAFLERHRKIIGWLWTTLIVAVIARQLYNLGLHDVLGELPDDAMFFVLYVVGFLVGPLCEKFAFRVIWPKTKSASWYALLRKRALNFVVLGYSGDVWFAMWARENLKIRAKRAFHGVKDSTILGGIASAMFTVLLVASFAVSGEDALISRIIGRTEGPIIAMAIVGVVGVGVLVLFRRSVFGVNFTQGIGVFAIHFLRVALTNVFLVLQYAVVLPFVPFETWLLFITVQMLIQQLPLIPNRDLLFLVVAMEITRGMGVDQTSLSALLVATTLLRQIGNTALLIATTILAPRLAPEIADRPGSDWAEKLASENGNGKRQPAE